MKKIHELDEDEDLDNELKVKVFLNDMKVNGYLAADFHDTLYDQLT